MLVVNSAHAIRTGNRVFQHLPALLAFNATEYIGDPKSLKIPFPPLHYYPYEYQIDEVLFCDFTSASHYVTLEFQLILVVRYLITITHSLEIV